MEAGIPVRKLFQLIQIGDDSGLVQNGSGERSEKRSDFGYILMLKPIRFDT